MQSLSVSERGIVRKAELILRTPWEMKPPESYDAISSIEQLARIEVDSFEPLSKEDLEQIKKLREALKNRVAQRR